MAERPRSIRTRKPCGADKPKNKKKIKQKACGIMMPPARPPEMVAVIVRVMAAAIDRVMAAPIV